ncbi:hypothetical protein [Aquariibacter albus]|uniref:Uncharacterized protein n=1 Tax=Aquariibacter albus TaxID=2759899 RepID=A0A839HHS4_9BURK|nr:hypothetical protein [Aquariibacter albus]MBB1162057.1 hypothetical protein [Aquariibacter albus]
MSQPLPTSEVIAGLLALGVLQPDEVRAVEPLLSGLPEMRGRLDAWQRAVQDAGLEAEGQGDDAWSRLEAQLGREAEQRLLLMQRYPEFRDEALRLVALLRLLLRRLREVRQAQRLALETPASGRPAAPGGPRGGLPSGFRNEDASP